MSGKIVVYLLISFTILFGILLYYFQVFAFYKKVENLSHIEAAGIVIPVNGYIGIDSETSGLKLRGCFTANPELFETLPKLLKSTPLSAPFWFDCFDNQKLQEDIDGGSLDVFMAKENEKDGIDRVVAIYPNGEGFQWRQLNAKYAD